MFQGLKRVRFENKVDQFKNFITEECKAYNMREYGTLDEMYCISICKFLHKNGISVGSVEAEVKDNTISIRFPEKVIHNNSINVSYSDAHTMVTSLDDNFDIDVIEVDYANDDQIFSKYIDLFMDIYNK